MYLSMFNGTNDVPKIRLTLLPLFLYGLIYVFIHLGDHWRSRGLHFLLYDTARILGSLRGVGNLFWGRDNSEL
jgi:hypothetical protein